MVLSFSDRLISLGTMLPRSIHVAAAGKSSSSFSSWVVWILPELVVSSAFEGSSSVNWGLVL